MEPQEPKLESKSQSSDEMLSDEKINSLSKISKKSLAVAAVIVILAFFGFIFAAPGAVMIAGVVSGEENGKIAAAGPFINLILAMAFWLLANVFGQNILFSAGFQINAWLAFFNLLPFWQLDGLKVMNWDTKVWGILIALAGVLTFLV